MENKIDKYLNEKNTTAMSTSVFLADLDINSRKDLGIIIGECCASCVSIKKTGKSTYVCSNRKVLIHLSTKEVITEPDLCCKYYN